MTTQTTRPITLPTTANRSETTKDKISPKEAATLAVAVCRSEPIWKAEKEIEKIILKVLEGHQNG